jgi:Leucine-rich repeat (LRR) protein
VNRFTTLCLLALGVTARALADDAAQEPVFAEVHDAAELDVLPSTTTAVRLRPSRGKDSDSPASLEGLQSLDIDGCDLLRKKNQAHLARLVDLSRLDLEACEPITDQSLADLSGLSKLQELVLSDSPELTDRGLAQISRLTALQSLTVAKLRTLRKDWTRLLASLPALRALRLRDPHDLTGPELGGLLRAAPRLETLRVDKILWMTRGTLESIAEHPALRDLGLELSESLTAEELGQLAKSPTLQEVHLTLEPDVDPRLERLGSLSNLTSLVAWGNKRLTDEQLGHLAKLPGLRTLRLDGSAVTDAGLAWTAGLQKLEELSLTDTAVTDAGLDAIAGRAGLKRLWLGGKRSGITDKGLAALARLESLERLHIERAPAITDAGLEPLIRLPSLRELDLEACPGITDAGLDVLARSASLRSIDLSRTKASALGVQKLWTARPELSVTASHLPLKRPTQSPGTPHLPGEEKEWRTFVGTMGTKTEIQMALRRIGGRLDGSYFYRKHDQDIPLEGMVDAQNNVVLQEHAKEGPDTGTFRGRFVSDDVVEGFWSKPDGTKKLSFALRLDRSKAPDLPARLEGVYLSEHEIHTLSPGSNDPESLSVPNCLMLWRVDKDHLGFSIDVIGSTGNVCSMAGVASAVEDGFEYRESGEGSGDRCILRIRVGETIAVEAQGPCAEGTCGHNVSVNGLTFRPGDRDFTMTGCPSP